MRTGPTCHRGPITRSWRRRAASQTRPSRRWYEAIEAEDVLSIHISGALSGTVNSARTAAADVRGKRIQVVDSRAVSLGLGFLAQMAAQAAGDGASLEDVTTLVESNVAKTGFYAVLETLQHAQRSGRISFAQALLGSMLQIKPILTLREGAVHPVDRPRTTRKALERIVELTAADAPLRHLAVLHANNEPLARDLAAKLEALSPGEVEVLCTGAVVGTHCGPGAVASCYVRA
jgi:fatty acid kinase fatty acid binding subunit